MAHRENVVDDSELPLLSKGFLVKTTIAIGLLAAATFAIGSGGHWLGQRLALGGHSESDRIINIAIGEDRLRIPANMIRFESQRKAGTAERLDLYLTWPGMQGYSKSLQGDFDSTTRPDLLIFLQISQSTMSRDMSGRLEPIYSQLFAGGPKPYAFGLSINTLKPDSGYGSETILSANRAGDLPYAVRCMLPEHPADATGGDCQRDIHVGQDLTVLYRFSSTLLSDWHHIDAAVRSFVETRLDTTSQPSSATED